MTSLLTVSQVENPVPGKYIVILKKDVSFAAHVSSIRASTTGNITHEFKFINGYAGEFSDGDLNDLRANPDIASIEQDSFGWLCSSIVQDNATWGLGRISSVEKLTGDPHSLTFKYKFDDIAGSGVNIYVLDTGVDITHPAFEGRASWGMTANPLWQSRDLNGHGTHCAGTAASLPYGVAKDSNVITVKVWDAGGVNDVIYFIAGVSWVLQHAAGTGLPSVVSLHDRGITVVVAAGNSNMDAIDISPARSEYVITVAASDIHDTKWIDSNYGGVVDIWAPGVNVISTWKDGGTQTMTGTSMAAAHVSGFAAYLLNLDNTLTPDRVAEFIKRKGLRQILNGVAANTPNVLLNY